MRSAFILGIDGLPYTLTHRLMSQGIMPNMAALCDVGSLKQMHTTIPDFSCVAWTSFATGVNPGKHGIYGFLDFDEHNASIKRPDYRDCKSPSLWHLVGDAGGRSIIFNLPNTYPAQPLRGKMVSGFIAQDLESACYPPMFAQTMRSLGYRMDLDGIGGAGGGDFVKNNLIPVFEARKKAIRHIVDNEYWDLCVAVITETDRLQHFFLQVLDDKNHPEYEWVLSFYKLLDDFIGELADKLSGRADLFMVSDHGFNVVRKVVVLERFLEKLGLSSTNKLKPCLEDDECIKKSKVLILDPGRFYINRKNSRFEHGFVSDDEADDIIALIAEELDALVDPDTGEKITSSIRYKSEFFYGEASHFAPDLVVAANPGYHFKSHQHSDESDVIVIEWEANHVWNDAIFYTPFKINDTRQSLIWDVFPTVLDYMGIDLPAYLDGKSYFR